MASADLVGIIVDLVGTSADLVGTALASGENARQRARKTLLAKEGAIVGRFEIRTKASECFKVRWK